jgi:hypothetical protein
MPQIDYKLTAEILTGGEPMAFKDLPDGTLVVIAHDGKKHRFTPEQVQDAQPEPPGRKPVKRERPPKAKPGAENVSS